MFQRFFSRACSIALLAFVLTIPWSNVQAADHLSQLSGIVRMTVVEGDENTPVQNLYFIEQCDGQPCGDFAVMPPDVVVQHVYLEGKFDLSTLFGKEVVLYGLGYDEVPIKGSLKTFGPSSFNQKFEVLNVFSVKDRAIQQRPYHSRTVNVAPMQLPSWVSFKNLVILPTTVSTNPNMLYSTEQFRNLFFTGQKSLRKYYNDSSSYHPAFPERFTIKSTNDPVNGDVAPSATLTSDPGNCSVNMFNTWRIERDNLAAQQGYPIAPNQIRVIVFAAIPGCTQTAVGTAGIYGDTNFPNYIFVQLPLSGTQADLDKMLGVFIHESQHNKGQGAHSQCVQGEGGQVSEYGDYVDPLGLGNPSYNSVVGRLRFGLFTTQQLFPVIQTSGTHPVTLLSPYTATRGISPNSPSMAAIIPEKSLSSGESTGYALVVEPNRKNLGWDFFGPDLQPFRGGATIRRVFLNLADGSKPSQLIDTTPSTASCKDAPLVPGPSGTATWTSTVSGVSIQVFTPTQFGQRFLITLPSTYPPNLGG